MQEQQELADNMLSLKIGLAVFFSEAHRVANEAIREQTELLEMENGPDNLSELLGMLFSTEAINRAQVNNANASNNPLQSLFGTIGGAINGITGEVAGMVNNVTGGKLKDGTVTLNGTDPISDILNGVGGTVNSILGNVGNLVGQVTGGGKTANGNNINGLGGLLGDIANNTGALLGEIANSTGGLLSGVANGTGAILGGVANGTGGILNGVANDVGGLLNGLTNGLISPDVINEALALVGNILSGVLSGNLGVDSAINQIIGSISQATGADNPLGKFLQNLANYLSNNQDGIIANVIKLSTFINAVSGAIGALISNSIGNVSANISKSISDVISGVIARVLGGGLIHRTQDITAEDMMAFKNVFLDSMLAVNPNSAAYAQQLYDILYQKVQKIIATDPFVLMFLANPTEENIRRAANAVAKVITEHHN